MALAKTSVNMIPLIMIQNSFIDRLITKEIAAYAAGLFDGEGNIQISRVIPKNRNQNFCYTLRAGVAMTDPIPIKFLKKYFGGSTTTKRHKNAKWNTCYSWFTWGKYVIPFLKIIYPYSLIKKEQIENAIEFREHMELFKKIWPGKKINLGGIHATLPQEVIEYREKLFQKSKNLKKRIH